MNGIRHVTVSIWLVLLSLASCGVVVPALANEEVTADGMPFLRDSTLTLQMRSHYLDRHKNVGSGSVSWAGGGWLEYRSGWAFDHFRLGLTGYASQKLYGPPDKDGAAVLATGQQSYSVLGETFLAGRLQAQTLTAGRFLVNQHEGNPQDTRMSPRTFQGAALNGKLGPLEYFAAYLTHMKTRNSTEFVPVATVAGASATVQEPMLFISGHYLPDDNLNIGFSGYRIKDVLASRYLDASYLWPQTERDVLRLGGQLMQQGSTGAHRLTGSAFDTYSAGLKLDWLRGPLTLSASVMQTGGGAAYRTPFGSWQGYACRIITSFNRAGERVHAYDAALDFGQLGMPGLALNGSATFGRGAMVATSGAALPDNAEYDLTLDYRFTDTIWPEWARPLWLRLRTARLEQRLGGVQGYTTEQHAIINYTAVLK